MAITPVITVLEMLPSGYKLGLELVKRAVMGASPQL